MKVLTAEQMREIDRITIEDMAIPGLRLMENAGKGVSEKIIEYYPNSQKIGIFCGKGNNGGDGLVCARHLINQGRIVSVFLLAKEDDLVGDVRSNLKVYCTLKPHAELLEIISEDDLKKFYQKIKECDLFVDALLGTGVKGAIRGLLARTIELINSLDKPIVSIDIPSGLDSDSGLVHGISIRPSVTVSLGLPKLGLVIYPGAKYIGKLEIIDIGIPDKVIRQKNIQLNLITDNETALLLPKRDPESHKGSYGHLLVLAGSPGFTGAAVMSSRAGLRSGAGLVTLGIPHSLEPILSSKLTEVMTIGLPETNKQTFDINAEPIILDFLNRANVLAIGPGISTHESTLALVRRLIQESKRPMVIDADGLSAFSRDPSVCRLAKAPLILTPHPGEMGRLVHLTSKEIQANRIEIARKFSIEYKVYLVLKGARTIIAEPSGQVYINPTGNAGMATGGSGDILTGMISGLLTQNLAPLESCILGVYLHGLSGDLAVKELTQFSLIASDILTYLPQAIKYLEKIRY